MDFPKSVSGVGLVNGQFVDEDATTGLVGSLIPAAWGNALTNEILNVIKSAGLQPDEANSAQLLAAIGQLIANNVAPSATVDRSGVVELATAQEGIAGTDTVRAIVPAVLAAVLASYAKLASPAFTGAPTAPTAALGTNSQQLANTAFVQAAIAALVDSSPAALNTLNELATALGDDPNFATTMTNALAGKQPLLGFTPIQQGGGANQGPNKLNIGWGNDNSLKLQVDSTDFGSSWPISISGRAAGNCQIVAAQSLSGTAFYITGIPSWAKRLRVCLSVVSINTATAIIVQLGTSAGIVNSGYNGSVGVFSNSNSIVQKLSSGVQINATNAAAGFFYSGTLEFESMGGNLWAFKSVFGSSLPDTGSAGGSVSLPGGLTTLRITSFTGTGVFSAGTVSVTYEG